MSDGRQGQQDHPFVAHDAFALQDLSHVSLCCLLGSQREEDLRSVGFQLHNGLLYALFIAFLGVFAILLGLVGGEGKGEEPDGFLEVIGIAAITMVASAPK